MNGRISPEYSLDSPQATNPEKHVKPHSWPVCLHPGDLQWCRGISRESSDHSAHHHFAQKSNGKMMVGKIIGEQTNQK